MFTTHIPYVLQRTAPSIRYPQWFYQSISRRNSERIAFCWNSVISKNGGAILNVKGHRGQKVSIKTGSLEYRQIYKSNGLPSFREVFRYSVSKSDEIPQYSSFSRFPLVRVALSRNFQMVSNGHNAVKTRPSAEAAQFLFFSFMHD